MNIISPVNSFNQTSRPTPTNDSNKIITAILVLQQLQKFEKESGKKIKELETQQAAEKSLITLLLGFLAMLGMPVSGPGVS